MSRKTKATNSKKSKDNFDDIVDSASTQNVAQQRTKCSYQIPLLIKHGAYYIIVNIWRFFFGPSQIIISKQKDSRFKFVAEQLISTLPENADPIIIETSANLLSQHRTIENTEARRRLEKWACRTIIIYLISVFLLVLLNGFSRVLWPQIFITEGFISDTVMYVILSTTTVNIIGLGIIVLKGHFPKEENGADELINTSDKTTQV